MSDDSNKGFTFDPDVEGQEVPTLTSLLYKKNLVKSEASDKSAQVKKSKFPAATLEPTRTENPIAPTASAPAQTQTAPTGHTISLTPANTKIGALLRPQEPAPVNPEPAETLPLETVGIPLTNDSIPIATPITPDPTATDAPGGTGYTGTIEETDPIRRGIAVLTKRKLHRGTAVFRAEDGTTQYKFFEAVARRNAESWNGMVLDPADFADVFSRLGKFGFVEFSPLSSSGPQNAERMGFRTAFGVGPKEWITIVRIGNPAAPEAIAVVVSEGNVQAHLPFFHTLSNQKAA